MRIDEQIYFGEFDALVDPRDIAARDDAMAFDRSVGQ